MARLATKGELASDLLGEAYADDVRVDFVAGDEVYGACTKVRAGQDSAPQLEDLCFLFTT